MYGPTPPETRAVTVVELPRPMVDGVAMKEVTVRVVGGLTVNVVKPDALYPVESVMLTSGRNVPFVVGVQTRDLEFAVTQPAGRYA